MELPSVCPVCGGYSLTQEGERSTLLAVCNVLCFMALDKMGRWIVRAERSRYRALGTRPWYVAHTLWQPDDAQIDKCLRDAWQVVPAMLENHGTCDVTARQVESVLNSYIHDLLVTGTAHSIDQLAYRFQSRLGLPVYVKQREPCYG